MNKTVTVILFAVAGIGVATYTLRHGAPPVDAAGGAAELAPTTAKPAAATSAARADTASAPAAAETANVPLEPKDEAHSQFGHTARDGNAPDTLTTSPDQPADETDADDGKSLAPALVALNSNLKTLLKDAGPDAAAEIAALPGARAAIERLLTDADPAVREQASEVLKSLSGRAQ